MDNQRNYYFDNLKFILITLVVFGHFIEPLIDNRLIEIIYLLIYSFHMPLFVFVSGYFSKPNLKGTKKIILYFLVFEVIYGLFFFLSSLINPELIVDQYLETQNLITQIFTILTPIWLLWFLVSLICWRLLLLIFQKNHLLIYLAIVAVFLFNLVNFDFRVLSLGRTITYFPYFLIGYYLKKNLKFEQLIKLKKYKFPYILLPVIISSLWIVFIGNVESTLLYGSESLITLDYTFIEILLTKLLLFGLSISSSLFFLLIIPQKENIFTKTGSKTLSIYLLHGLVYISLFTFNFYYFLERLNPGLQLIVTILLTLGTVYLLEKADLNKFIPQKEKQHD